MSAACIEFRGRLERALAGRKEPDELRRLGWHAHLGGCAACRALLEGEEALELLLETLPDPRLPPDVARRVLARLREMRATERAARGDRLDALLDLAGGLARASDAPADLSAQVLAGIAAERARAGGAAARASASASADERLDRLLDRVLGEVDAPADLGARVRTRLALERGRARRAGSRTVILRVAAALLVAVGGSAALWRATRTEERGELAHGEARATEGTGGESVSDALLASLDVLESWDALESAGLTPASDLPPLEHSDLLVLELLAAAEHELGLGPGREDGR